MRKNNKWDSRHTIGIESIKRQHPAYLPRGSRARKREFEEIVYYLMTSLPSLRPGEHDFDHIMTDAAAAGIGKSGDGDDGDDDSGYGSNPGPDPTNKKTPKKEDGEDQKRFFLFTPPPGPPPSESDSAEDCPQHSQPYQHRYLSTVDDEPSLPHPRKFSFVWVNMADEIHGCNSYDSYHLVAALNRMGLNGCGYSSATDHFPNPAPRKLSSHLPTFLTQIRQLFALDKSQIDIWYIELLYIPSDESRDQRTVLRVSEKTWGGIKGLIERDEEANFDWRVYTRRKDLSARLDLKARVCADISIIGDRRKKKKGVKFVSTKKKDGDLELLNGFGDGEKRRRIV